jgi:hypothetical protein
MNNVRKLTLQTGGTIGMKNSPKGYVPVQNFLGTQLSKLSQFHDKRVAQKHYDAKNININSEQVPTTITKDSTKVTPVFTCIDDTPTSPTEAKSGTVLQFSKKMPKKQANSNPEWFFTPKSKQGVQAKYKILEYNPLM